MNGYEIFNDITSGDSHEVDLVVKVRFKSGQRAFFLIHVESQASSRKDFARRMFQYFARLHEKYGLPVFPVAIFSFDRPLRPEPDHYRVDFPDFRVLDFAFRAIQLNSLNWRDFVRKPNPVAGALMTKMKIESADRPRVKLEILRMLATLKLDKARATLIGRFMINYLKLTSDEALVYNRMLRSVKPHERKAVMTLEQFTEELKKEAVEEGLKEGLKEGLNRGLHQGRQEGARDLLIRQLRTRLGKLSAKLSKQVERLDDTAMFALGEALLDFRESADAERWFAHRSRK